MAALDLDLALDPSPFSRLLIASTNAGKIREFRQLLAGMGLEIAAQPGDLEVEETGATFAENARLKAITVARHSGSWTLADDSGLSVAALNGAPGVHSARYAATDPARISRLLHELAGSSDRTARFCAALALADPNGNVRIEVEGLCAGVILEAPAARGGLATTRCFSCRRPTSPTPRWTRPSRAASATGAGPSPNSRHP